MKKRIVYVTGCLGFIGFHITRHCLDRGWYVIGVDKMTYASNDTFLTEFKNYSNFKHYGTYHAVTNGETTWYRYAKYIQEESIYLGLSSKIKPSEITPGLSINFPTKANRPLNSRLCNKKIKETFMIDLPHWQDEVKNILKELIL